ncbi:MAG: hypothetical protein JXB47_14660 [Anaerolineae bacterium]|nr:hypothetical protein [Anaerolineae bacterium]
MHRNIVRMNIILIVFALAFALSPARAGQAPDYAWYGEYFNNPTLAGGPTCVVYDNYIDFSWGLEKPGQCDVGPDNFSVRWTRLWDFGDGGLFRFYAASDDGVRIYVDGQAVLNDWKLRQAAWTYTEANIAAGQHEVRVEYFEAGSNAEIEIGWEWVDPSDTSEPRGIRLAGATGSAPSAPGPTTGSAGTTTSADTTAGTWRAEYFNNIYLYGDPVLVREEPSVNYEWGYGSPAPGIVNQAYFSARWTRTVNFTPGEWIFTLQTDDGARLYVGQRQIISAWYAQWLHTYTFKVKLSGPEVVRLEFFEQEEIATIKLAWRKVGEPPPPEPGASATFSADRTEIAEGECATLAWDVQNARAVYYQGRWVNRNGSRQECPTSTTEYVLRVVQSDGTEQNYTVTVTVTANPSLIQFAADRTVVNAGECATLSWSVQNARAAYYQGQWVNLTGSRTECPTQPTNVYSLRVVKNDGSEETREVTVYVGDPNAPVINFSADRTQINAGECVTVSWNVQNIRAVYYQNQGVTGSETRTECPATTTTYILRVVKLDGSEETRSVTVVVGGGMAGGDVQVTLTWNSTANLNLFVTDPTGFVVHYAAPVAPSGGRLERDANQPCSVATTSANENIYWPTGTAPGGAYSVRIDYTNECVTGQGPVNYSLTVRNNGAIISQQNGTIALGQSFTVYTFSR